MLFDQIFKSIFLFLQELEQLTVDDSGPEPSAPNFSDAADCFPPGAKTIEHSAEVNRILVPSAPCIEEGACMPSAPAAAAHWSEQTVAGHGEQIHAEEERCTG